MRCFSFLREVPFFVRCVAFPVFFSFLFPHTERERVGSNIDIDLVTVSHYLNFCFTFRFPIFFFFAFI